MSRKRKLLLGSGIALFILCLTMLIRTHERRPWFEDEGANRSGAGQSVSAKPHGVPQNTTTDAAAAREEQFVAGFRTPISFFGRVVDQYGNPVPQANVTAWANDKPFQRPAEYHQTANKDGTFSITGIYGITLAVEVSKAGYQIIPAADNRITSSAVFDYASTGGTSPPKPTRAFPATFTLRKPGTYEPLVVVGEKNFAIARDGTPLAIHLDKTTNHDVVLRCWNTDKIRAVGQRTYDWRLEIVVPHGGLVTRNDAFAFEAPEAGYVPADSIEMPASLPAGEWSGIAERSYFLRFDDGIFARVHLEMHAGGDHFVVWESHLNPRQGSRVLEPDPSNPNVKQFRR